MKQVTQLIAIVGALIAASPKTASANKWDELRCTVMYPVPAGNYYAALKIAKAKGWMRDRLHAHGLLDDFLKAAESARRSTEFSAILAKTGPAGVAVGIALLAAEKEPRCLKAGIDIVFPDPPPPPPPPPENKRPENKRPPMREEHDKTR